MNTNEKTPDLTRALKENVELRREVEYLRDAILEQEAIIKQLTGKISDVEYIHPFDVADMLEDKEIFDIVSIVTGDGQDHELIIDGRKYKQSPLIPPRTTKYS